MGLIQIPAVYPEDIAVLEPYCSGASLIYLLQLYSIIEGAVKAVVVTVVVCFVCKYEISMVTGCYA